MLTETVPQASRVLFHPAQWKSLSICILQISKAQRGLELSRLVSDRQQLQPRSNFRVHASKLHYSAS